MTEEALVMRSKVVVVLLLVCVSASAWAQSKAKRNQKLPKAGDEMQVVLHGDESRLYPGKLEKAGVLGGKEWIVLVAQRRDGEDSSDTLGDLANAARAGDALAVEAMIKRGRVARVDAGTRVLMLGNPSPRNYPRDHEWFALPDSPHGPTRGRVQDGPLKGRAIWVPIRNLQPAS
jgi:hypothetical protein